MSDNSDRQLICVTCFTVKKIIPDLPLSVGHLHLGRGCGPIAQMPLGLSFPLRSFPVFVLSILNPARTELSDHVLRTQFFGDDRFEMSGITVLALTYILCLEHICLLCFLALTDVVLGPCHDQLSLHLCLCPI